MQEIFDKIIEKLESEAKRWEDSGKEYEDRCEVAVARGIKNAIKIVKQEAKQYNNGWISCIERLPEKDGFYLATLDGEIAGEEKPFSGLTEFENGK